MLCLLTQQLSRFFTYNFPSEKSYQKLEALQRLSCSSLWHLLDFEQCIACTMLVLDKQTPDGIGEREREEEI